MFLENKCEKKENSVLSIYDPLGVKLFTRLRLQFSHPSEHKFEDTINVMCACGSEVESTLSLALSSLFSTEISSL